MVNSCQLKRNSDTAQPAPPSGWHNFFWDQLVVLRNGIQHRLSVLFGGWIRRKIRESDLLLFHSLAPRMRVLAGTTWLTASCMLERLKELTTTARSERHLITLTFPSLPVVIAGTGAEIANIFQLGSASTSIAPFFTGWQIAGTHVRWDSCN